MPDPPDSVSYLVVMATMNAPRTLKDVEAHRQILLGTAVPAALKRLHVDVFYKQGGDYAMLFWDVPRKRCPDVKAFGDMLVRKQNGSAFHFTEIMSIDKVR